MIHHAWSYARTYTTTFFTWTGASSAMQPGLCASSGGAPQSRPHEAQLMLPASETRTARNRQLHHIPSRKQALRRGPLRRARFRRQRTGRRNRACGPQASSPRGDSVVLDDVCEHVFPIDVMASTGKCAKVVFAQESIGLLQAFGQVIVRFGVFNGSYEHGIKSLRCDSFERHEIVSEQHTAAGHGFASTHLVHCSNFGLYSNSGVIMAANQRSSAMEHTPEPSTIVFPGTDDPASPWRLYNHLIAGIPEDIFVRDYCLGLNWSYVEADCGCGVAYTGHGRKRTQRRIARESLREVAELSKSWCSEEATHRGPERLVCSPRAARPSGCDIRHRGGGRQGEARRHVVERRLRDVSPSHRASGRRRPRRRCRALPPRREHRGIRQAHVLGRSCRDEWIPDPACEYVMPTADYAFITSVTLINKTAPRLSDPRQDATVCMVGPSIMTLYLFEWGVESLSGSVVAESGNREVRLQERCRQVVGQSASDDHHQRAIKASNWSCTEIDDKL